VAIHSVYFGEKNLTKAMAKDLERKNGIFGTFIYENNGN